MGSYLATDKDLRAIEEGISYVWHPKLDFIFPKKELLQNVAVVSYDKNYFYLWLNKQFSKYSHDLKIDPQISSWWRAYLLPEEVKKYLPKNIVYNPKIDFISGGLLTPFIALQKARKSPLNPYVTEESYLATIVHEYAHVYFHRHGISWFSDKANNLQYLQTALALYQERTINDCPPVYFPLYRNMGEIFAFATDYSAASIFWPKHKADIDRANIQLAKKLLLKEKELNLFKKDSSIEINSDDHCHHAAAVFGKLILHLYPTNWPHKLLSRFSF